MWFKLEKALVALAFVVVGGSMAWASCGGTEALVSMAASNLAGSVTSSLTQTTTALVNDDQNATNKIVSALRILTKQVQASGDKLASATVGAEESGSAVAKDLADKEIIDKVVLDYTSQGYQPCLQSDATKKLAATEAQVKANIPGLVRSEVDAGSGKFASSAATMLARSEEHQALFCSQAEVDSGACDHLGKIPGGDTNAALLFSTDTSSEARAAKNQFINNVIGLPDQPLSPDVANTPEGSAYLLATKKRAAFLAFPAYSLKTIQAENENLKPVLDDRIGMYFGTSQAADWARSQTSQATRGILVDLVKMQGLNLNLAERRMRQNMRIEANLALLLELENEATNGAATNRAAREIGLAAQPSQNKVTN